MKRLYWFFVCTVVILPCSTLAQAPRETVDTAAISAIRDEGMNRSKVMEILGDMTDVYGPRMTWSPGYRQAAEWAVKTLESMGLMNPHLESFEPLGKSWVLRRYSANVIGRQVFPLISYPKAWSPGTRGTVTGELVHLDAKTDSALATFKGKLKGKFVLFSDEREIKAHFEPQASREPDSSLLRLANADLPDGRRRFRMEGSPEQRQRALIDFRKWELCQKEGAAGVLTISRGDGGNIFVQQSTVPYPPDVPFADRLSVYDPKAPKVPVQIAVGAEHYNRLVRMIRKGERPKLELGLDVDQSRIDSGYNVIAEIPGTDLKDEIVMIGAHFDSWHGATGATDNATGSAACMEAVRILKALDLKPRRTIRIALWGGEEQGLHGSKAHVKKHFGEKDRSLPDSIAPIIFKPDADRFSVYFNNDNGTGKVRGVYMQGNEAARSIFRAWLRPFADLGASTLTLSNTGGTDHVSFDGIGLPGFQFIQDDIEYPTRTHHSTMDLYDRVQEEDLKQASVLMAAFAYNAAMRDSKFPRKPVPQPVSMQGSR